MNRFRQFEPLMSFNMNDFDLYFTYCSKSQWMEIMPVPTCCKLHAHNYTCIPIFLGRRGTPDPTGQLVSLIFVLLIFVVVNLSCGKLSFSWNGLLVILIKCYTYIMLVWNTLLTRIYQIIWLGYVQWNLSVTHNIPENVPLHDRCPYVTVLSRCATSLELKLILICILY